MKVEKLKDKIVINGLEDFNIVQILNCGQIFRYSIDGDRAEVFSKNKKAVVLTDYSKNQVEIISDDPNYFYNFFDLDTNYSKIKHQLKKDSFLLEAVDFGYGIRIINNDAYEMLISFIISANNNIGRIKKSIAYLCEHFGSKCTDYYAFPTLDQLKKAKEQDFVKAGLGYRAPQMYETVQRLTEQDITHLKTSNTAQQFNFLVSLKGVGEKVANCVLLFGLGAKDVFPVDTWINKVYNKLTNTNQTNRALITKELTDRYGKLSGYAQQYFFYYFRDNKLS